MAQKPQMLKDFLEMDWDYESCSAEPDAADTVRRLIDSELRRGRRRQSRKLSASALTRISSVIKMLPIFSSSSSSAGLLSRSYSKRMKIHFWRKRGKSEAESEVIDDERLRSCCLLSPVVSSCSSWSFMTDSDRDFLSDEIKNGSPRASPCPSPMAGRNAAAAKATMDGEGKEPPECHSSSEEEKEQLSPLSVMEFPSEGEEEEEEDQASSPSFLKLQRTKSQLLRRIGRLQLLPNPNPNSNPVILDRCFATCNDDDMKARRLLQHFTSVCQVSSLDAGVERLLVDFFVCSLFSRRRKSAGLEQQDEEAWRLILVAREWMEEGRWCGADDYHGETTLREIEEGENGWLRCEAAEEVVAVGLEGLVIGFLVQELVVDLATS